METYIYYCKNEDGKRRIDCVMERLVYCVSIISFIDIQTFKNSFTLLNQDIKEDFG